MGPDFMALGGKADHPLGEDGATVSLSPRHGTGNLVSRPATARRVRHFQLLYF
jgi:hypothetical protein